MLFSHVAAQQNRSSEPAETKASVDARLALVKVCPEVLSPLFLWPLNNVLGDH